MRRAFISTTCIFIGAALWACESHDAGPSSSSGESALVSEVPLAAREEVGIRDQIERNWNLGSLAGSPSLADLVVELRIGLLPDGTVTKIEVVNDQPGNPEFRQAADSAKRAVMISSPLKLPAGKTYSAMRLRFYPGQVVQ